MTFANSAPPRPEGGSLVQTTVQTVTNYIREKRLRVGDTLPGEAHFAQTLGVSRAVMREAFGALAALKLIDVGNGRKPRVGALDGSVIAASLDHAVSTAQITVPEIWDVRRTMEVRTAALAAANRSDEEAERILALAQAMLDDRDDHARRARHDIDFHNAVARASHNILFEQIVSSFAPLMEVAVPTAWRTRTTRKQQKIMIDRHRAIAAAISARDASAAAAAMSDHFDASVGDLLKAPATEADAA